MSRKRRKGTASYCYEQWRRVTEHRTTWSYQAMRYLEIGTILLAISRAAHVAWRVSILGGRDHHVKPSSSPPLVSFGVVDINLMRAREVFGDRHARLTMAVNIAFNCYTLLFQVIGLLGRFDDLASATYHELLVLLPEAYDRSRIRKGNHLARVAVMAQFDARLRTTLGGWLHLAMPKRLRLWSLRTYVKFTLADVNPHRLGRDQTLHHFGPLSYPIRRALVRKTLVFELCIGWFFRALVLAAVTLEAFWLPMLYGIIRTKHYSFGSGLLSLGNNLLFWCSSYLTARNSVLTLQCLWLSTEAYRLHGRELCCRLVRISNEFRCRRQTSRWNSSLQLNGLVREYYRMSGLIGAANERYVLRITFPSLLLHLPCSMFLAYTSVFGLKKALFRDYIRGVCLAQLVVISACMVMMSSVNGTYHRPARAPLAPGMLARHYHRHLQQLYFRLTDSPSSDSHKIGLSISPGNVATRRSVAELAIFYIGGSLTAFAFWSGGQSAVKG